MVASFRWASLNILELYVFSCITVYSFLKVMVRSSFDTNSHLVYKGDQRKRYSNLKKQSLPLY